MSSCQYQLRQAARVVVPNHFQLLAFLQETKAARLLESIHVERPLFPSQLRRLPPHIKKLLVDEHEAASLDSGSSLNSIDEVRRIERASILSTKLVLSVKEAAELSGFSSSTITSIFQNAKGVRVLNRPEKMHKRKYRTIMIPRAVFDREMRRITN